MDNRKPSEAELQAITKKILLLKQKYKQQKKEERIYMKRNRRLVNEIQTLKETSKSLIDERLALQKDMYEKKLAKAVSEGNNITLKNSLSSFLNDLHALQTKVINSWRETQRETLKGNKHSSQKPEENCPQESMEEEAVAEKSDHQPSPLLQDMPSSLESVLMCKVEALNTHQAESHLTSPCDISESKEELSLLLESFCRRDTVPLDKPIMLSNQESKNVVHEIILEPDSQESNIIPLEETCKPILQDSENGGLLERICEPDHQEPDDALLEESCTPDPRESLKTSPEKSYTPEVLSEKTCKPTDQQPENVFPEKTCEPEQQQTEKEAERRTSPLDELFYGFEVDSKEKTKFKEMIEKLNSSIKSENLESLRSYEIGQSLTVFESNPEVTANMEAAVTSSLEVNWTKHYNIQEVEVSIPRLDLSLYPSLNNTIEIPKKDVSRKRKSVKNTEDRKQRDTTPDSASESSNGRALRRARNPVSYKEKPLKTKLRRS